MKRRLARTTAAALLACFAAPALANDPDVVAEGGGMKLLARELDPVLLDRYGVSDDGREILKLMVSARLLARLGAERGIVVAEADVTRLWGDLDRQARASGESNGLAAEIKERGLTQEEFRDYLELSILQERLTSAALDLPDGVPASGAQQEVWLQQELAERGLERPTPPWRDGVVARLEDILVTTDELGRELRRRLPRDDVRTTCWHLLLLAGIDQRMPDVSAEARQRAIDQEMERRRRKAMENPDVKGLRFEDLLAAKGTSVAALAQDPSVRIAALTRLWVDRTAGPDGLRATYERERATFEGRFGKAVRAHLLFLVASRYKNELNPRSFEDAERLLEDLRSHFGNTDDFESYCAQYTEDPGTRPRRGDLGWVTRDDPRYPAALREAIFEYVDTGGRVPAQGVALGPLRLDTGSGLLWLSAVRESPSWEVMSEYVHEELRRRFIEDVLQEKDVKLLLDP